MATNRKLKTGELLVEYGYLNEQALVGAMEFQEVNKDLNLRLADVLIQQNIISESSYLDFLARHFNTKVIDIKHFPVELGVVELLPRNIAEKYTVFVVAKSGQTVKVAMNDPFNIYAQEEIRSFINDNVEILIGSATDISTAIEYYYSELEAKKAAKKTEDLTDNSAAQKLDFDLTDQDETPIVKFVNTLLLKGYATSASDIHIEPFEKETIVRMRIDGILTEYLSLDRNVHNALVARIKIISSMDIAEKRLPQDGHFRYRLEGKNFNIRSSIAPTVFGEKVVMRFLNINTNFDDAKQFGMREYNYNIVFRMLQNPHGIIYITGATGSGKTSTLYMMLEYISQKNVSISTIEDPVEKNIHKVCQMQVNNAAGLTFESGLRSILRQDPDIIMVGETRDEETAAISVRAAITGHLVLSTIHTNDAVSTISRLLNMKIPAYMVSSSLSGVIAQRLVRKICGECKTAYQPTADEKNILGEDIKVLFKGNGCQACNYTGYKGRIAIHEILEIDNKIRHMIDEGEELQKIQQYCIKEKGMSTLMNEIKLLINEGVTTVFEFIRLTSAEDVNVNPTFG